jgi:hypothetical protein
LIHQIKQKLSIMNTYKTSPANNFKGSLSMDCEEFTDREAKDLAVVNWFNELKDSDELTDSIHTNVIGYILDDEGERIGYIEEHYIDSGSVDYYYTALISNQKS